MVFSARLEQSTCGWAFETSEGRASHSGSENRLPHPRSTSELCRKKVFHPVQAFSFKKTCYGVYLLLWVLASGLHHASAALNSCSRDTGTGGAFLSAGDSQQVSIPTVQVQTDIPSLYKILDGFFPVGAAIWKGDITGPHSELLRKHFNSITTENAMKMGVLQPSEGTFDFTTADELVRFARANLMLVRGHTLVWHKQNPPWVFKDSGGNALRPTRENRALLLGRLEKHIRAVVSHYKGEVYAWDVVNEAVDPEQPDGFRRSPWLEIIGPEYIETAFRIAHEASPGAKLYINEYDTTNQAKRAFLLKLVRDLKRRGVPIDGVGHQMHNRVDYPSTAAITETLEMFSELGVGNQITELDISVYRNSTDSYPAVPEGVIFEQGYRYRELFQTLRRLKGKVSSVTFWGFADDHTWLKSFPIVRRDLPLLFDEQLQAKPAYWGIVDPSRLPTAAGVRQRNGAAR